MALNCVSTLDSENFSTSLFSETNLVNYVKEISKYKSLTIEEEQELARQIQNGSKEAKEKLTKANLKLVVMIARKVIHTSKLPMTDRRVDCVIFLDAGSKWLMYSMSAPILESFLFSSGVETKIN